MKTSIWPSVIRTIERHPTTPLTEKPKWTPETHMIAAIAGISEIHMANRLPRIISGIIRNPALLRGIATGIHQEARELENKDENG